MAAATPANRIEVNMVADEGDAASSRPAWFWCWNNFNFGWGGGWGGYNWYQPVYSWNYGYNNYWAYRWAW
jgi:hypothetical protein